MARSAKKLLEVDVVISTTGFFGPLGGERAEDPPVGTAYISIITPEGEKRLKSFSTGDREAIAMKCRGFCLSSLLLELLEI